LQKCQFIAAMFTVFFVAACGGGARKAGGNNKPKTEALPVGAADSNVKARNPEVVKEHLVVDTSCGKWKIPDTEFYLHLRCQIVTRQHRVTLGSKKGKQEDSDLADFGDFTLTFQEDKKVKAAGLGFGMPGQVTLYKGPDEYANLVNVKDLKEYEWEIDIIFALPKGTRKASFRFVEQEPVMLDIPSSLEGP